MIAAILVAIASQVGVPPALTVRQQDQVSQHFRNGMQALQSEKWDRAETEFNAALRIDALHDASLYGLGQVHMMRREYHGAIRAYVEAREAFLTNARLGVSNKVTNDRRIRDQIQALEEDNRRLERAGPSNPFAHARLQQNRTAIRQLQGRLTLSAGSMPDVPAGLSMALGSAYFRIGSLADAEREYLEAIRADPSFGEAHSNLAVVYMLTNRLDQAERAITLAEQAGFKVNPDLKADLKKRKGGTTVR